MLFILKGWKLKLFLMHSQWKLLILQTVRWKVVLSPTATLNIDFILSEDLLQNRKSLRALAEACDRYQIRDRAGAAIASAVLVDFAMITPDKYKVLLIRTS